MIINFHFFLRFPVSAPWRESHTDNFLKSVTNGDISLFIFLSVSPFFYLSLGDISLFIFLSVSPFFYLSLSPFKVDDLVTLVRKYTGWRYFEAKDDHNCSLRIFMVTITISFFTDIYGHNHYFLLHGYLWSQSLFPSLRIFMVTITISSFTDIYGHNHHFLLHGYLWSQSLFPWRYHYWCYGVCCGRVVQMV